MTATNPITTWREALVAHLAQEFPAADVDSGERPESKSRDKDRIRVFWPETQTDSDVDFARPQLIVRYWVKFPKVSSQLKRAQIDEGPLEQAGWNLTETLMTVRTTLVSGLAFELARVTSDREEYGIEAQLIAWTTKNPAA